MADNPKYYTPTRGKATQKWIAKNLEEVRFRVRKGEKDALKEEAQRAGLSVAQYLVQAVNAYAGRQILTPSSENKD